MRAALLKGGSREPLSSSVSRPGSVTLTEEGEASFGVRPGCQMASPLKVAIWKNWNRHSPIEARVATRWCRTRQLCVSRLNDSGPSGGAIVRSY